MQQTQTIRYKLLTWLVIFVQITAALGVGTVTAIQPTPQMAQAATPGGVTANLAAWYKADGTVGATQGATP